MTRRNTALFVLIALASMTIGDWSQDGSLSARAGQSSNVPRPQQKPANSIPQTIWEYKLLYATTSQLASLEGEINDYARDGFVVDSVQAVSNMQGGNGNDGMVRLDTSGNQTYDNLFRFSSTSMLIVLLKRIKR